MTDDTEETSSHGDKATSGTEQAGSGHDDPGSASAGPAAEGPVRSLSPRIRLKWYGAVLVLAAVLTAVAVGAVLTVGPVPLWVAGLVPVVVVLVGVVLVRFRYRAWTFRFRRDHLFLERGVITKVDTVVPYVRIQHVDTNRGPADRLLGLSTLVVYTAGSRGADVSIPGLEEAAAEEMQSRVKELAIDAEGGEGL
jgi:membrane protein YdbS with pleckstrin-like domain